MRLVNRFSNTYLHNAIFQNILGRQTKHESDNCDVLELAQLETLADMLGLSLDDTSMYCLAWSWSCQLPLKITKNEFMKGLMLLEKSMNIGKKCDTTTSKQNLLVKAPKSEFEPFLTAIRNHIDDVKKLLRQDVKKLRDFYRFIFKWVQSPETTAGALGNMGLNIETATELWRMLFPEYKTFVHMEEWIHFCTTKELFGCDYISRDLWEQFFEFTFLTNYDTYDVCDAWPSAIDDFVSYFKNLSKTNNTEGKK